MKKTIAFLLALVMVASLLPGTAVTVSAAEEEVYTAPKQNNYYSKVIVNEGFANINSGMTKGKVGTSADEQYTVQGNHTAKFKTGTMTADGVCKEVAIADIGAKGFDMTKGFEVYFEANFNDLVVADPSVGAGALVLAGFSVDVRAASRCRYGFHADAEGNIYVTQYDSGTAVRFDTGVDVGSAVVKVRIVVDDQMKSTVMVNGQYVGRFNAPNVTRPDGDYFVLYTGTKYRSSDARVNDVTVHDIKLSQTPATDSEMEAYYTFEEPYLDGLFNEFNWPFDNNNKVAMLSDEEYLYVALNTTNAAPKFTINGVVLNVDLASGIVTTVDGNWAGDCAISTTKVEIRIPLKSVLGLDYAPGQKVGVDYQWGDASFTGAVVLAGRALVVYEGFDSSVKDVGVETDEVYALQKGDGRIQLKTGVYSEGGTQDLHHKLLDASSMEIDKGVEYEFTADFTDLVVGNTDVMGYLYMAGFGLEVRADPCHRYGFHADAEGNIYVTQRMDDYTTVTRVDTGIDVGATNVNVRLSADDAGVTTIYINGVALEEQLPASSFTCPKTGGRGYYQFQNSTKYCDPTSGRVNDVSLYNLALYQEVPAPELQNHPKAADSSADITAYLNPNGIKLDGVLDETEWYTPYAVAGADKAPGGLVGVSWGDGNLYVGGDTRAEVVGVRINGHLVVANLRPYQAPLTGRYVAGNSGFEWIIPLERFGLNNGVKGRDVEYEILLTTNDRVDVSSVKGTLHFTDEQMLLGETGRNYSGKDYFLGVRNGHIRWERTDDGFAVTAESLNILKADGSIYATGTFCHEKNIAVDYTEGAIDLTMSVTINDLPNVVGTYGMRGLIFEICGVDMRAVFALRKDANGNIWMDLRDELDVRSCDTGVDVGSGSPIEFRFAMDDQKSISLYVNGELVHAFEPVDRRDITALAVALPMPHFMIGAYNSDRDLNADGTVSTVDAVIHDLRLTKKPYAAEDAVVLAALEKITEQSIIGNANSSDVTTMNLPTSLVVDDLDEPVSVSWIATDAVTGRTAYGVNLKTGVVTRQQSALGFNLKAVVSHDGVNASKSFAFQTKGTEVSTSNVALIVGDDTPATGTVTSWDGDMYAYLDNSHNSLVLDQGENGEHRFNRIVLRDGDEYSRVSLRHLGVFISNDGQTWTKVTGWLMHQSGRNYTLYNLDETARYVKVHCYHDDLDLYEGPTFYNRVADMMSVSYDKYLPGAYTNFAHSATFAASNDTDKEKKDAPVFVSLTALGATAEQHKAGCADFRFTIGDTTLAHWYNGTDGFYVRVPAIPANGSTEITAHWGCGLVEDFSDGEAVFEVTYGNVSLVNLSKQTYESSNGDLEKAMLSHGRPFTFPNGDIIVVARTMKSAANEAVYRSTDGGHTFKYDKMIYNDADYISAVDYDGVTYRSSGMGGYLWDGERDENPDDDYVGRLYVITYSGQGGNDTDYRLVLNHTDDYGATWSKPVFLSVPGTSDIIEKATGNSVVLELKDPNNVRNNGKEVVKRSLIYGDAVKIKGSKGAASDDIDYVIVHSDSVYECTNGDINSVPDGTVGVRNVTTAIYSTDNGATWTCSDSLMYMPNVDKSRNVEDGLSEFGFTQLDDGTLRTVMRSQSVDNYYQYEGISEDFGKTWTSAPSGVISSNTSPVLTQLGNDRLEMWSACTGLGMASYRRTPMHLGLSTDNYESFDKILDLTFATAFDSVQNMQGRKAQPGIGIYTDEEGNSSAFVCYYDQTWHLNPTAWRVDAGKYLEKGGTMGFAIEEFDQMVYGTKGAWDDFEDSSLKYQGWLVDTHGTIELSREQAVSGRYSMKVLDKSAGAPTHALRQIPSMKSGTVGAKLMIPSTNQAPFVMELKAAYNYDYMKFTVAAIFVTPAGSVGYVDANGDQHVLTTVERDSWNDYALTFDVSTGKGALYVNGKQAGSEFDLPDTTASGAAMHGATVVQFNQIAGTIMTGDCLYVDDFFANELPVVSRTLEEDTANQTLLGRFVTIVRKIVKVNDEDVEIVEWGWVPGL